MRQVTASGQRQCGMRAVKTASSVCIRSAKPPVQGQRFLDLYVLQRDRARWRQLQVRAEDMIRGIDRALDRLGLRVDCSLDTRAMDRPAARRETIVTQRSSTRRRRTERVA